MSSKRKQKKPPTLKNQDWAHTFSGTFFLRVVPEIEYREDFSKEGWEMSKRALLGSRYTFDFTSRKYCRGILKISNSLQILI